MRQTFFGLIPVTLMEENGMSRTGETYINPTYIEEWRDEYGTLLFFTSGRKIKVKETMEEIRNMLIEA